MAAVGTDDSSIPSRLFAPYQPRGPGEPRAPFPADVGLDRGGPNDADGIAALYMLREEAPRPVAEQRVARWLAEPEQRHLLLVARHHSTVVGYARAAWVDSPADEAFGHVPAGWYLMGVVVHPAWRRRGIAAALTANRLAWISRRAPRAYYFANSRNRASIELHRALGFREAQRDFQFPGAHFSGGGTGILFAVDLFPPS